MFGRRASVKSGPDTLTGVAEDLDADGSLLLRTDGGKQD